MKNAEIGLGCWAFGEDRYWGKQSHSDSVKTIQAALRGGIRHFDTARSYGNGRSEQITGQQLKQNRENVVIATKTTWLPTDSVEKYIDMSLRRLCTDWIDILYIHWPKYGYDFRPMMETFERLRSGGKIKKIGVSNFSIRDMENLKNYGQIEYYQTAYSLIWRLPERKIIPYCRKNQIKIVSYSPLGQGILTDKFDIDAGFRPEDARSNLVFFHKDSHIQLGNFLKGFRDLAMSRGFKMSQLALYWNLTRPWMDTVLAGARNREQIEENLSAGDILPDKAIMTELTILSDSLLDKLPIRDNIFNHNP